MLYEIFDTIREFLDRGGQVMVVLGWVVFIMWTLILERLIFMRTENRVRLKALLAAREAREDQDSWHARAIYDCVVSQLSMRFEAGIQLIRALARLCPLFGLMGTVTGMIVIFEVMAWTGSSSPRAMSAGVAQATLTTMAGMVGALSGIFPAALLNRLAHDQRDALQMHRLTADGVALSSMAGLPKTLRWLVAPTAALFVTMGLLFMMQTLIETGEAAIQKVAAAEYVEFIRVPREERVEQRSEKPQKIMPEAAPEMLDMRAVTDQEAGAIVIGQSLSGPAGGEQINLAGLIGDFGSPDGEFLPVVRVLPIYPRRAQLQGLEGWVMVEFTITESGTVKDVKVLESSHAVFEGSAVRAVGKFKYRPRIVNGRPVPVTGVIHKVTYEIEE
ncbi:MAG: TonB family protein [Gammaproteobacteria bacterium]|nr:TonB family protein [Gammaproteobacteria bacterium]